MATENVRIKYVVDDKQLEESNKELEKSVKGNDKLQKEVGETNEKYKDQSKAISGTNKSLAGLGGQLKAVGNRFTVAGKGAGDMAASMFAASKATQGTSVALKILKVAIASTGIGLFIVAIGSLAAAFKSSEAGQNKFAKIMAVIGVVVGNVSDLFAILGERIIEAFESPQEALTSFTDSVKNGIGRYFNEILPRAIDKVIGGFGLLFDAVKELDFDKAIEGSKLLVDGLTDIEPISLAIKTGFESATVAVKEFAAQTGIEINKAIALEKKRAETDIIARQFLVDTAELEGKVADLRLKGRQEDEFTAKERLAFLNEANELQNKLIKTEALIAKNRAEEATISNTFSKSTKENLDAEAELKAQVFRVETKRLNQQRTLQREINTTSKQAQAASAAEEKELEKLNQLRLDAAAQRGLALAEVEAKILESNGRIIEAEKHRTRAILDNVALTEDEKVQLVQDSNDRISEIRSANAEATIQSAIDVSQSIFETLQMFSDFRVAQLEQEKAFELQLAGDNVDQKEAIETKFAAKIAAERTRQAKINKAAAIIQAGISTALGIVNVFAAVPVPAAFVIAGLVATLGTIQTAIIAKTPTPQFEEGGRIGGDLHSASSGGTHILAEKDEFIMSRKATAKYGFGLMDKINGLELDQEVLTGRSGGSAVVVVNDNNDLVKEFRKRPENNITIDEEGFTMRQRRNTLTTIQKAKRYST